MRCKDCRKVEAESTKWERTRYRLMYYLFAEDVANLIQEKYTQGYSDGLKQGFKDCLNHDKDKELVFQEMVKEGLGEGWIQKFAQDKPIDKPLL